MVENLLCVLEEDEEYLEKKKGFLIYEVENYLL